MSVPSPTISPRRTKDSSRDVRQGARARSQLRILNTHGRAPWLLGLLQTTYLQPTVSFHHIRYPSALIHLPACPSTSTSPLLPLRNKLRPYLTSSGASTYRSSTTWYAYVR
eukprot:1186078-Prorocentrum_minimum.AAC.2